MSDEKKPFWRSLPGILTGIAAVITALTTFYVTIGNNAKHEESVDLTKQPTMQSSKSLQNKNDWILEGEDVFIDEQTKWPIGSFKLADGFERFDVRVVGGKYRVDFESPYGAAKKFRLAVDMKMVSFNSDHIMAGIHFGYSSRAGYLFNILTTGKWAVHKTDAPDKPVIEWTNAGLNPKNWNRLDVEVDGIEVRLRINSKIVAEYTDNQMSGGIFGFYIASNDENGKAVIDFDNFEYYRKKDY